MIKASNAAWTDRKNSGFRDRESRDSSSQTFINRSFSEAWGKSRITEAAAFFIISK